MDEPLSFNTVQGNLKPVNLTMLVVKHNEHTFYLVPVKEMFGLGQFFKSRMMNSHPSSIYCNGLSFIVATSNCFPASRSQCFLPYQ